MPHSTAANPARRAPSLARRTVLRGLLAAACGRTALAAPGPIAGPPPAETLFAVYGFDADDQRLIAAGDIITRQLPSSRAQQMVVASALVLPRPLAEIAARLGDVSFYPPDPDLIAAGTLAATGRQEANAWRGAGFTAADAAEIDRLRGRAPGDAFNLSRDEIAAVRRRLAGPPTADAATVSATYRDLLITRAGAYAAGGLAAIAPYDRGEPAEQRVDQALAADASALDALIAPHLAALRRALALFPHTAEPSVQSRLIWRKTRIDGRTGHQLLHRLVSGGDGWLAAITRQFYVAHSYDCLQALAVFYDLGEATLLIDHNSTTTDRIPPLFGALARQLGGDELRRTLARHFTALRERAAAQP